MISTYRSMENLRDGEDDDFNPEESLVNEGADT